MENNYEQPPTPPKFSTPALAWLYAHPVAPDTSDIFNINEENFAIKCIRAILENRAFYLPTVAGHPAADSFNHFYFELRNREKIFGSKNFGVAYPYVRANFAGLKISAPLFYWHLNIEPHAQLADNWTIQRLENQEITPNYPLFHLLDTIQGTDFSERVQRIGESGNLPTHLLSEIAEGVRLLLDVPNMGLPLSLTPFPAEKSGEFEGLFWSATAGLLPNVPVHTLTEEPFIIPDLKAGEGWQHPFTVLPLDPSQRSALISMQNNVISVVEGASGTGKTYAISSMIINALSNGKKILVVSRSLNALRRAQRFVLEKGVGDLTFILRDTKSDRLMLADMLRAAAANKVAPKFEEQKFKTALNKTARETKKLDSAWKDLHAPIFGETNFVDTVGRFMRANRAEGKELLSKLNPTDFQFNKAEFDGIVAAIRSSEPLFRKFPNLHHPLSKLDASVFVGFSAENGLSAAKNRVQTLLDSAVGLHHKYIARTSEYTEMLTDAYETHFTELSAMVHKVRNQIEDGTTRYGQDFDSPVSVGERIGGVFMDKYKEMTAAKERISIDFQKLQANWAVKKYFDFDFPASFDAKNIPRTKQFLQSFDTALQNWRKRIPATVREDLRRLNSKSLRFEVDFKEQVRDLETSMEDFLEQFNQTGLYGETAKHEMLTIPKRQEFLEEQIARLENTDFYLRDFPAFYEWQRHWLELTSPQQAIVAALCQVKPKNWVAAFESWYLHNLLQKAYNPALVWEKESLGTWSEGFQELKNLLPSQISALWHHRKIKALRQFKTQDSQGYNTWFGAQNRTASMSEKPENLFKNHIFELTETLPVLLVTPQVALDVVRHSNLLFDVVLIDEGHNIPQQECRPLFEMAKNVVVFGDSKQDMTPYAEDDILEFCKKAGAPTLHFDCQHQLCPEEWIRFNSIAFNTPFKRLPSQYAAKDVTTVEFVDGRYDEFGRTNEAEARQIISWLNLIEPTPAKTYPVVGIACATVQQRNLIAAQLLRIRQQRGAGHEKIQQLHLNGLGVYQFSELQGQHVDILLISMTHGMTDTNGTPTRDLHFWNTKLGMNQLHVVLTRATNRIFIAHSIPQALSRALAADSSMNGTATLANLVNFAEYVSEGETELAENQLNTLRQTLNYPPHTPLSNTFMEEVEIALQPYFEAGRVQRNADFSTLTVPLMIDGTEEKPQKHILFFDGVLAESLYPSYEWEDKLQNHFRNNQAECVPTLSVHWWKAPRQEARKLAGRVLKK